MDLYDWARVREEILAEVLPSPTADERVAVAGLLFEYRLVFNAKVRELTEAVEGFPVAGAPAFTFEEAAAAVARAYRLDARDLEARLRAEWARLRTSDAFRRVRAAVESHRFVERLEPHA